MRCSNSFLEHNNSEMPIIEYEISSNPVAEYFFPVKMKFMSFIVKGRMSSWGSLNVESNSPSTGDRFAKIFRASCGDAVDFFIF